MRTILAATLTAATVLVAACQTTPEEPPRATAELRPTKGNKAFGEATFEQAGDKVRVIVFAQGLSPGEEHAMHIHEAGDCGSGDGMSAKGPLKGDLPPLKANKQGRGRAEADLPALTLTPGPAGIVGRGLIVYGRANARIACGVIKAG